MPNLETESKNKSKTWVSFGPVWPSCLNLLFGHWQFRAQKFLGQQFYHYASPERFLQYSQKLTTVLNPPIRWWVIFRNPIRKQALWFPSLSYLEELPSQCWRCGFCDLCPQSQLPRGGFTCLNFNLPGAGFMDHVSGLWAGGAASVSWPNFICKP